MCDRFANTADDIKWREYAELIGFQLVGNLPSPRQEIPSPSRIDILRVSPESGRLRLASVSWGLVPNWPTGPTTRRNLFNVRAEIVHEKADFRDGFEQRRCVIPTTGFYKWQKQENGTKRPYFISTPEGHIFSMAGLWETCIIGGCEHESCTILTTRASDFVKPIHHRMPVILTPQGVRKWLAPETQPEELRVLLMPLPAETDLSVSAVQ